MSMPPGAMHPTRADQLRDLLAACSADLHAARQLRDKTDADELKVLTVLERLRVERASHTARIDTYHAQVDLLLDEQRSLDIEAQAEAMVRA